MAQDLFEHRLPSLSVVAARRNVEADKTAGSPDSNSDRHLDDFLSLMQAQHDSAKTLHDVHRQALKAPDLKVAQATYDQAHDAIADHFAGAHAEKPEWAQSLRQDLVADRQVHVAQLNAAKSRRDATEPGRAEAAKRQVGAVLDSYARMGAEGDAGRFGDRARRTILAGASAGLYPPEEAKTRFDDFTSEVERFKRQQEAERRVTTNDGKAESAGIKALDRPRKWQVDQAMQSIDPAQRNAGLDLANRYWDAMESANPADELTYVKDALLKMQPKDEAALTQLIGQVYADRGDVWGFNAVRRALGELSEAPPAERAAELEQFSQYFDLAAMQARLEAQLGAGMFLMGGGPLAEGMAAARLGPRAAVNSAEAGLSGVAKAETGGIGVKPLAESAAPKPSTPIAVDPPRPGVPEGIWRALRKDGKFIGEPNPHGRVNNLPGGRKAAEALFKQLTGRDVDASKISLQPKTDGSHAGDLYSIVENGNKLGSIAYRVYSATGGTDIITIDVAFGNLRRKFKFTTGK